jgi:mannitol-specific phosphotransferase system IIBC component
MASEVLNLAAEVHDRLLKIVAPASPGSIEASSLSRSRNPALFFICVCAAASFLIFIIPIIVSAFSTNFLNKDFGDMLRIVGGAGLGSSFYALHTASSYITSGTFDPKYNNTYLIRLSLGLLSGLILAYFLKDFINAALTGSNNAASTGSNPDKIGVSVSALALIGGYAAEAVAQILGRVSDTLVTLISGSDKDKIAVAKQKADADAEKKTGQALGDAVKKLQQALSDSNANTAVANVQKVMSEILDRK